MKKISTFVLCVFTLVLFIATKANAAMVTVSPAGASYSYSLGGVAVDGNVDLGALKPATGYQAKYTLDQGSLTLQRAALTKGDKTYGSFQHVRPTGVGMRETYLSVFGGDCRCNSGTAVFSLNAGYNTFSFEWGSIDRYNWVEVTNGKNQTYAISGADLMANMANIKEGKSSKYFSLTDMAGLLRVVLRSYSDAFEVSNVSVSSVPLPAALPLFGAALGGMALVRRRQRAK